MTNVAENAGVPAANHKGTSAKRSMLLRAALAAVFVSLSFLHDWLWLRVLTATAAAQCLNAVGLPVHRIGMDVIELGGIRVQMVVACTMIYAFLAGAPLGWRMHVCISRNIVRLALLSVAVFALNVVRVDLGLIALDRGAPWWLAHDCMLGVAYFCVFLMVVHERAWKAKSAAQVWDAQHA